MPGEDFSILSRRKLLGGSLAAGGFLLMGGVGGLFALRGRAPVAAGLRALTDHEYRTLSLLARALFPAGGAFALGGGEDLARAFDAFLADEPPWNQTDLKRALFLLEFGPVIFERRLRTFSHLSDEERLRHFQSWAESDSLLRRQVAVAFRKFLCVVFYDQPAAWAGVGYEGPLIKG